MQCCQLLLPLLIFIHSPAPTMWQQHTHKDGSILLLLMALSAMQHACSQQVLLHIIYIGAGLGRPLLRSCCSCISCCLWLQWLRYCQVSV